VRVPNAHRFGETGSSFHRLATGGYRFGNLHCLLRNRSQSTL
jgi:hypothetical protein